MAIRTVISIFDEEGFESDRIRSDYTSTSYDARLKQQMTLAASTSKVKIDLGPLATIEFLFISTDKDIDIYADNSAVKWDTTGLLLIVGCSFTALHIVASEGAVLVVYMAGS
jgi:hypothetical protein